jgi:hypothetical protein
MPDFRSATTSGVNFRRLARCVSFLADWWVLYHIFVKKQGITAKNALFQINIMLVWGK